MSQEPNVPVERQAKRHKPAIIGIAVAILAAIVAFFVFGAMAPESGTTEVPASEVVAPANN